MSEPDEGPRNVTTDDERRRRRQAAQRIFDTLALDYRDHNGVSRGIVFGSAGLRVHAKFFAFVGRGGQLIVKLPMAQAAELVARGAATPVRAGRSTTREWVGIPAQDAPSPEWRALIAAAHSYVTSLMT